MPCELAPNPGGKACEALKSPCCEYAILGMLTVRRETAMKRGDLVPLLALVGVFLVPAPAGEAAASLQAYSLFLAGASQGAEEGYVPLLVVPQTLEDVAASGRDTTVVLITTYERDSIWKVERGVSLAAADVSAGERIVRLRGRWYRYQEIAPAEVLHLLEKPEGTIPIHRYMPIPDKKSLEDLIAAFRGGN
jgi:hypothetical protein